MLSADEQVPRLRASLDWALAVSHGQRVRGDRLDLAVIHQLEQIYAEAEAYLHTNPTLPAKEYHKLLDDVCTLGGRLTRWR